MSIPIPDLATGPIETGVGEHSRPDERPADIAPLLRTGRLRRGVIWAGVAWAPATFLGDYIGAALMLFGVVSLIAWTGVIATNVRRSRPATRHGSAPHPARVAGSWFVAPVVSVAALFAIGWVATWADSGTVDQEGLRAVALSAAVVVAGLAVLIAAYRPYRMLSKCAKWVSADARRFRKWFAAPIAAALLAVAIRAFVERVVLSDGSSSTAAVAATALWIVSFTLPWLAWLIFGSRAMRTLESGVEHAHQRATRTTQDPAEMNPLLVGQVPTGSVRAPALSAPNA